jgi:hypothetical protein
MSNPNWPDDSQLYPGTPAQQPGQQQPANPTPYPGDPSAPPQMDAPGGQPPMAPPSSPFSQPAPVDPSGGWGGSPYGAPNPNSMGYGQQPSAPNLYGAPPSTPFGQPGMPVPPYGYPGTPSQALPGYQGTPSQALPGYPGTPSQQLPGYPGMPSQTLYGQPGAPSMPMYSQTPWGAPSQTLAGGMPAPKRRLGKKPLFIALSIVVVLLLLVGGGAAYVVTSLGAPAAAATQFCGDLKAQNYSAAYGMFSSALQSKYSSDLFTKGAQALDTLEGPVTQCDKAAGSGAYTYSFGASTATLQAAITRGKQGSLNGVMTLKNQNGNWKVDALDTSLLGINLDALQTINAFCQALQASSYESAYGILGATPQAAISKTDFVANANLDDKYDGALSACSLTAIASGNTDTATTLTVSVTRAKLGAKTGNVALDIESGTWKINTIDTSILGTDYRPLVVAQTFCTDYQKGNLSAAYGLMAPDAGVSKSDFVSWFQLPSPLAITQCGENLSTYKVTGTTASLQVNLTVTDTSTRAFVKANATFHFALEQGKWGIADLPSLTLA